MQIKLSNKYDESKLNDDIEIIKNELSQIYNSDNVVLGRLVSIFENSGSQGFKKIFSADVFIDGKKIPDVDVWRLGPEYKIVDELRKEG